MARNKNKQKTQYKTLLSVLANGSTDKALALLKKHSGEDASDTKDLELKLAKAYASSTSKRDIEKEFAEIHPHKDFILRYVKPIETLQPLKPETTEKVGEKEPQKSVVLCDGYANANGQTHAPCGNPNCPHCKRYFSNCEGNASCSCNKSSSACGSCSQFSGGSNASGDQPAPQTSNNTIMVVGLVSVVAIVGMVLYLKSSNK